MTADTTFNAALESGFVWVPEIGMGYFPVQVEDEPYRNGQAEAYWQKYASYAETPLGEALTQARVNLVREWTVAPIVDVGIGAGAFIEAMHAAGGEAYGCDVNPTAVTWLHERGLWRSPWEVTVSAVSLWDVLEHLADPAAMLANVSGHVFVSLPVFRDGEHVLISRHFRRDEHRWYWSVEGLIGWMRTQGFECLEHGSPETALGREDIDSFVFRRAT